MPHYARLLLVWLTVAAGWSYGQAPTSLPTPESATQDAAVLVDPSPVAEPGAVNPCRRDWVQFLQTIRWGTPHVPDSSGFFEGKCAGDLFNCRLGDSTCFCF